MDEYGKESYWKGFTLGLKVCLTVSLIGFVLFVLTTTLPYLG